MTVTNASGVTAFMTTMVNGRELSFVQCVMVRYANVSEVIVNTRSKIMKVEELNIDEIIKIVKQNNVRVSIIMSTDDKYEIKIEPVNTWSYTTPIATTNIG